ncbi:hypothetical protein TNCV_4714601 [Trichonephila clavipes]|nr:hypothetical protein TNCV_4714601 [Trichonephila clavipes]
MVDDMIKENLRITIDGVMEELGIGHERVQKLQSPEFFLEGFLKLIKRTLLEDEIFRRVSKEEIEYEYLEEPLCCMIRFIVDT